MKPFLVSIGAAIVIAIVAALILGALDMSSMTMFQSPGNVRL